MPDASAIEELKSLTKKTDVAATEPASPDPVAA